MARTNFAEIKSLEDSFAKELSLRLAWHRKRRQDELTAGKEKEKPRASDILRKKLMVADGDPTLKKKTDEKPYDIDTSLVKEPSESKSATFELMLPIDKSTKDLLYDGISRDGKGRAKYLKHRYFENPENKFLYPPTSGMEYGWNIAELTKSFNINKSLHGRRCILRDTFYRKNGIPMKLGS